jgi:hypothetical protein
MPVRKDLEELLKIKHPSCVTIYVPFTPDDAYKARISLKNLLGEAAGLMRDGGATAGVIRKLLRPLRDLLKDEAFWLGQPGGFGVFASPGFVRFYALPEATLEPAVTVWSRFEAGQLAAFLHANRPYLVLALGHKNVRLYEGDKHMLRPVELPGFPSDMKQALRIDEYTHSRQTHPVGPAGRGKGSEAFHEQYNVRDTDKKMLKAFFRLVEKRLRAYLSGRNEQLIIAGVGYLLPLYDEVNTYPHTSKQHILGNLERSSLRTIRQKADKALNHTF